MSGAGCRTLNVNLAGNACLLLQLGTLLRDVDYDISCPGAQRNATCGLCQGLGRYFCRPSAAKGRAMTRPLADNRFVLASEGPWYCVDCGAQLEPSHLFCWRCGAPRWTPPQPARREAGTTPAERAEPAPPPPPAPAPA